MVDNTLLFILSLIGLGALYWVLKGQAIHNKMMRNEKEPPHKN